MVIHTPTTAEASSPLSWPGSDSFHAAEGHQLLTGDSNPEFHPVAALYTSKQIQMANGIPNKIQIQSIKIDTEAAMPGETCEAESSPPVGDTLPNDELASEQPQPEPHHHLQQRQQPSIVTKDEQQQGMQGIREVAQYPHLSGANVNSGTFNTYESELSMMEGDDQAAADWFDSIFGDMSAAQLEQELLQDEALSQFLGN